MLEYFRTPEQEALIKEGDSLVDKILALEKLNPIAGRKLDFTNDEVIRQYLGDIPEQLRDLIDRCYSSKDTGSNLRKSTILNNFFSKCHEREISILNPFYFYMMKDKNFVYLVKSENVCQ